MVCCAQVLEVFGSQLDLSGVSLDKPGRPQQEQQQDEDEEVEDASAIGDDDVAEDGEDEGAEQDEDMDEDMDDDEDEDEDERAKTIECGKRLGRWERYEAARELDASISSLSAEQNTAKKRQIFDPKEAFIMLSKGLLDLYSRQSFDMFVDSVADDVYCWRVDICNFEAGSALAKVGAGQGGAWARMRLILAAAWGICPLLGLQPDPHLQSSPPHVGPAAGPPLGPPPSPGQQLGPSLPSPPLRSVGYLPPPPPPFHALKVPPFLAFLGSQNPSCCRGLRVRPSTPSLCCGCGWLWVRGCACVRVCVRVRVGECVGVRVCVCVCACEGG